MKVFMRSREVDAEQWTGDQTSLVRIQALLAPLSPYLSGAVRELGIPTHNADAYGSVSLTHVAVGGWVTKNEDGRVNIWTDTQFREMFAVPQITQITPLGLPRADVDALLTPASPASAPENGGYAPTITLPRP